MPNLKQHCSISSKRNKHKFNFKELHEWVDEPKKYLKENHRLERHSDNEIYRKFIEENWNDKSVVEWLFHIAMDNLQTAFKESYHVYGDRTYNYYQIAFYDNGEIYFDCDRLPEDEITSEFKTEDQKEERRWLRQHNRQVKREKKV